MSEAYRFTVPARSYHYACVESDVGPLLVVMSEDGLVDVIRGDGLDELLRAASARHPGVLLKPDRGLHDQWVAGVVERFEQPGHGVLVPPPLEDACRLLTARPSIADPWAGSPHTL